MPFFQKPRARLVPFIAGLSLAFLFGCTAKTASPPATTILNDLHPGADRAEVSARFGPPETSGTDPSGNTMEVFTFVEGDPVINPSPEDTATLEAAVIPGTEVSATMAQTGPITDTLFQGDTLTVQVNYDENDAVENTLLLEVTPEKTPAPKPAGAP
jgi:hypothetical protein